MKNIAALYIVKILFYHLRTHMIIFFNNWM